MHEQSGDLLSIALLLLVVGVLGLIAALIYFLPSIIAFRSHHPNRWVIFAINLFLGTTGIAWFLCVLWASMLLHDPIETGGEASSGGESGLNLFANDVVTYQLAGDVRDRQRNDYPGYANALYLQRLIALKDRGFLSDEEFETTKAKLGL